MHTMKEMRMIRRWITLSFSFRFEAFDQKISLAAFAFEPESFFCALVTKAFARYLTLITRNESSSIASVFLFLEGTSNESSSNNFCLASPSSLDVVMNVFSNFYISYSIWKDINGENNSSKDVLREGKIILIHVRLTSFFCGIIFLVTDCFTSRLDCYKFIILMLRISHFRQSFLLQILSKSPSTALPVTGSKHFRPRF